MKQVLFFFLTLGTVYPAFAGDSTWLVCNSKSLLVSAFEHRTGADTRQTDVVLLYGGHLAKGVLREGSNKVTFNSTTMNFAGEMAINFVNNKMALKGVLDIQGQRFDIAEPFKCVDKSSTTLPGR